MVIIAVPSQGAHDHAPTSRPTHSVRNVPTGSPVLMLSLTISFDALILSCAPEKNRRIKIESDKKNVFMRTYSE